MNKSFYRIVFVLFTVMFSSMIAHAEEIGGVEFPGGELSFADEVVSFTVGLSASEPYINASNALGRPDYEGIDDGGTYVSLGTGGSLILRFVDNSLTTSGDSQPDLWIFEIGGAVESTYVYISKDALNWIPVGSVAGSVSSVDIDAYIAEGVVLSEKYSYVKLIDDDTQEPSHGAYAGGDIDAVGAITSVAPCDDSDGDGVIDQWDTCPDTPKDSCVNKNGCPCEGLYTQEQVNQMISNILCWGDTNGDGKIGLEEAIHALQVTTCVTCKK